MRHAKLGLEDSAPAYFAEPGLRNYDHSHPHWLDLWIATNSGLSRAAAAITARAIVAATARGLCGATFMPARAVAAYYVQWTRTRVHDHGANFDLVIGDWGAGTTPQQRCIIAIAFRIIDGQPQFMVIDAADRPVAKDDTLAATALRRNDVIGTPIASEVFAILDAIWLGDERIVELSG